MVENEMDVDVAVGNEPQVLRQDVLENLFPDSDDDGEEFNGFTQQDIDESILIAPVPNEVLRVNTNTDADSDDSGEPEHVDCGPS